jgi:hypothetical protein
MLAYKFRPASGIHHALDVLLNKRLYCADWTALNDPMEGAFAFSALPGNAGEAAKHERDIVLKKNEYRVCSLAGNIDSHLVWAHYAGGFGGLAIEVDVPVDTDPLIRQVRYRPAPELVHFAPTPNPDEHARNILFSKLDAWKYESEIRVLSRTSHYDLATPPTRVIAGPRMHKALFDTLGLVCHSLGIGFARAEVGDQNVRVIPVPTAPIARTYAGKRRKRGPASA